MPISTTCLNDKILTFNELNNASISFKITCNKRPRPKSSTPALLLTTVRFLGFVLRRPPIKFSGIPQRPKPMKNYQHQQYSYMKINNQYLQLLKIDKKNLSYLQQVALNHQECLSQPQQHFDKIEVLLMWTKQRNLHTEKKNKIE